MKFSLLLFSMLCAFILNLTAGRKVQYFNDFEVQAQKPFKQRQSIMPRETNSCEERQTFGPICETCELLSACVHHSSGWVNIPLEICDTQNGYFCNSRLGSCSNATGPCHPFGLEGNFQCTTQGIFPNPYDCQKYEVCYLGGTTLVAATVDCVGDKAFNAATGQCSLTLDDPVCQQNQYECNNVGDAKPWPSNPNIFYICKATSNQDERVLYPSLYRCADGEVFDGYFCNPGNNSGNNGSGTTTSSPQQGCHEFGLSEDPNDCRGYFYCSGINGVLQHLECPSGTHFNKKTGACTLGAC